MTPVTVFELPVSRFLLISVIPPPFIPMQRTSSQTVFPGLILFPSSKFPRFSASLLKKLKKYPGSVFCSRVSKAGIETSVIPHFDVLRLLIALNRLISY